MLEGKEIARASHTRLHLIDDHENPMLIAQRPNSFEESIRGGNDAGLSLDGLQNDGGRVLRILLHQGGQVVDIAVRVELHPAWERLKGLPLARLPRHG